MSEKCLYDVELEEVRPEELFLLGWGNLSVMGKSGDSGRGIYPLDAQISFRREEDHGIIHVRNNQKREVPSLADMQRFVLRKFLGLAGKREELRSRLIHGSTITLENSVEQRKFDKELKKLIKSLCYLEEKDLTKINSTEIFCESQYTNLRIMRLTRGLQLGNFDARIEKLVYEKIPESYLLYTCLPLDRMKITRP